MQTIAQKILANPSGTQQAGYQGAVAGRTLYVQSSDAGNVLTITLTDAFGGRETVQNVGAGAKLTPALGFTMVTITTTADSNVAFIVTQGDIDIQLNQTTVNIGNGNGNPVPVAIVSEPGSPFPVNVVGTVTVTGATLTATNVGITQAGGITEQSPVPTPAFTSGSPNQVSVLAASAPRRRVAFRNAGTGVAFLGGAGVTPTNAVIALNPGDVWIDNDGAPAAWYATSDTGTTVNAQVMA
ncbi:hypothetical protein [Burkholderia cepacia]|uniref:hypothetical protein n=1 Tax=Burkholderia cepacia TaxID=292 RepID=UPI00075F1258|nr:hypothetical protein [Burkholderia cepacia]KWH51807.1 hypothetical protein WM00_02600 [Burkholderia cepacia]